MKRLSTLAGFALLAAVGGVGIVGMAAHSRLTTPVAAEVPPSIVLAGRVTDAAGILTAEQAAGLSKKLEILEQKTGHQMVVVTTHTLGGREIGVFTRDLGNAWGIGRAGIDDGVIVLIAPTERKARIEVGKGLESKLPDALCERIMKQWLIANAQNGNYAKGLTETVDALIGALG